MSLFFYYYFLRIEAIRAAQTTLRVKVSYVMIALTILGCIAMVIRGKQVSTDFWLVSANGSQYKLIWIVSTVCPSCSLTLTN